MSKHREAIIEQLEQVPSPARIAAAKPVQALIGECIGKMIACPMCGKPALVTDARGSRTPTQVVSSRWWVLTKCQGFCGSVLRRVGELVTILPESVPKPVVKPLGAAVGHQVLCPRTLSLPDGTTRMCGARSRAAWNMDDGHMVICPECGSQAMASETAVEMVG